jgi:4-hydroxy-tetrahydrodipicolinate synthase
MSQNLQIIRGTGVALVTPFKEGAIDWTALENIIEHVIVGGVDFLVSLGTTGESSTLSEEEHRKILDFTIKINAGRKPLVAGVFGGNNTLALVEKIKGFNFEGIDALLSSNPAYNKPGQEGIFQHYMAIAKVSPLPIIIYNVPSRSASNVSAETTLRLAHSSPKFIAIKEANTDLMQIMKILQGRPKHFKVLSGDDFMTLPIISAGGDGVISVIANALTSQFTEMVRTALAHDIPKSQKLNFDLLDMYHLIFSEGNPVGIKATLELMQLCSREVRLPLVEMTQEGSEKILDKLNEILN